MPTNSNKLLLEWQEEVAGALSEGFRQLFESSSQVLLEFADAAENNRLQRLFFDAQREFYLKEEVLANDFERSLRSSLLTFNIGASSSTKLGADTLSLVEIDDYERSLALETIAKRSWDTNLRELYSLSQRLSALLGGRPIPIEEVPANPMQIVRIFEPVSRKLEVENEVRLVFYTLFDRYVMSRLGELYSAFNRRLVDLGILPNIKFEYQRFGLGNTIPDDAEGSSEEDAEDSLAESTADPAQLRSTPPTAAETLSAISSLLMAKRKQQVTQEPLQTSVPITPTAANVGEAIGDMRVMQEAPNPVPIPSGPPSAKVVVVDAELLLKVKNALHKQRQIIKSLVGRDKLDRREEDVIDIVGMLFEAMLNEQLLPNVVKTLLSHLHTRYLKIAVQSQEFLENSKHPARRLFERMLDAGIRWVREDNLRSGIYPTLQRIVTDVLRTDSLDEQFFLERIDQLEQAERKLEQQSTAAEERTLEAERGRARLDQAKAIVKQTIEDIGGDIEVAPGVVSFLTTTFADYLTLLLLRSDLDTGSRAWNNAHSVGEALVAAAVYAAKGQPLGQSVRDDLGRRLHGTIGSLIPHHEQNIQRVIAALDAAPEKAGAADTRSVATAAATPPERSSRLAAGSKDAQPPEDEPATQEDQKLADKLMREAGSWFVMRKPDGGEQAVKLLWVNPHTRNMLLVDQQGAKVALMAATAFARHVREGKARPMKEETSGFIARSLRRIRRALEDSVNG